MPPKAASTGAKKTAAKKPASKGPTTGSKPAGKAAGTSKAKQASTSKSTSEKDVTAKLANLSTSDPPKPNVIDVAFKELADFLKDEEGKIKSTGKWPLLVDPSGKTAIFFRYQGGNYADALNPGDLQPEAIRKKLIGSIRYGSYFVLDFGDVDIFEACASRFDDVHKGCLDDVIDKTILKKYPYLIRSSDGPDYEEGVFMPNITAAFQFIVLTKIDPAPKVGEKFCVVKINHD